MPTETRDPKPAVTGVSPKPPEARNPKRQSSPELTISIVAVTFVVFMAVFIYTGPLKRYRMSESELADLQQRVNVLQEDRQVEEARLQRQETLMARLKERKPNFDLWSFMNTILTETKLKDRANLEDYRPRGDWRSGKEISGDVTMKQLKLNGVTLKELVDLLHKIYASNDLVVMYRLEYLRAAGEDKGLDCSVVFLTPKA